MKFSIIASIALSIFFMNCTSDLELPKQTKNAEPITPVEDSLIHEGVNLHDEGKYDEALEIYKRILKDNPENDEAIYEIGYTLLAQEKYDESLSYSLKGLEYKTDAVALFYNLAGEALFELDRNDDALKFYYEAIKNDSSFQAPYYNAGLVYWDMRKYKEAINQIEQSLRLDPEDSECYISLAELHENESEDLWAYLFALRFLVMESSPKDTQRGLSVLNNMKKETITDAGNKRDSWLQKLTKLRKPETSKVEEQIESKNEIVSRAAQFKMIISALEYHDNIRTDIDSMITGYFTHLNKSGNAEAYIYYAHKESGIYGVAEWIKNNQPKIDSLLEWDKNYVYAFKK